MPSTPIRAVSAAVFHEGRFLIVRRGRPPAYGLHAFPGGRVEPGETLEEAARREVMEETGADIDGIRHIVDIEIPAEADSSRIEFILSVHFARFAGGRIAAADDAEAVAWLTVDEMAGLPLADSVLEIASQIAAEQGTPCGRQNSA